MSNENRDVLLAAFLKGLRLSDVPERRRRVRLVDAALAAERKATVERIRAALDLSPCHECENADEIHRALDAEAADAPA